VLEGAIMGVIFVGKTSTLPELPVRYQTWGILTSFSISYREHNGHKTFWF
jgi:hypothetical protein